MFTCNNYFKLIQEVFYFLLHILDKYFGLDQTVRNMPYIHALSLQTFAI